MKLQPEDDGYVNPLYENRLIVLMENIDEGSFKQILLSPEGFKKVSDAIFANEIVERDGVRKGVDLVRVTTGVREIPSDIFDGFSSIDDDDE